MPGSDDRNRSGGTNLACRRIHEHWSNRATLHYYFSARRAHWYVDNRDGTYSMKEAGRAWTDNVAGFRFAATK